MGRVELELQDKEWLIAFFFNSSLSVPSTKAFMMTPDMVEPTTKRRTT